MFDVSLDLGRHTGRRAWTSREQEAHRWTCLSGMAAHNHQPQRYSTSVHRTTASHKLKQGTLLRPRPRDTGVAVSRGRTRDARSRGQHERQCGAAVEDE